MTTEEWQKRLENHFTVNGLVGGHLIEVHEREADIVRELVHTFVGQNVLIDSFQSFLIETLNLASPGEGRRAWVAYGGSIQPYHSLLQYALPAVSCG